MIFLLSLLISFKLQAETTEAKLQECQVEEVYVATRINDCPKNTHAKYLLFLTGSNLIQVTCYRYQVRCPKVYETLNLNEGFLIE